MTDNDLQLLVDLRREVPMPDQETAGRIYSLATAGEPRRYELSAPRRSRLMVVVAALALVLVAAALVPWGGRGMGFSDRALAAIGDGPMIHMVVRDHSSVTLIELATGKRMPLVATSELWYEPSRGLREITRVARAVQTDSFYATGSSASFNRKTFLSFATDYRNALKTGQTRRVGSGMVAKIPVYWLEFDRTLIRNPVGNRVQALANQVAVSTKTYRPVALRGSIDGKPVDGSEERILTVAALPTDAVHLQPPRQPRLDEFHTNATQQISSRAGNTRLGSHPLWLGRQFSTLALTETRALTAKAGYRDPSSPARIRWTHILHGLEFVYGYENAAAGQPFVIVDEVPHVNDPALNAPISGYLPPEGSAVAAGNRLLLHKGDLVIAIQANAQEQALAAARALHPAAP